MLRIIKYFLVGMFCGFFAITKAQSPDAELLVKIQTGSTADINGITGAEEGMLAYDTTEDALKSYDGTNWISTANRGTIILNRNNGGAILANATNTYFDFPLDATHTQANEGGLFSVVGTGEIEINQDGLYLLSAALSTSNLPAGDTKYILAARRNGTLIGYLSRGFVSLPSRDFWGSSGNLMYQLEAGDVINFQYVLNAGGTALNAVFTNASITKL